MTAAEAIDGLLKLQSRLKLKGDWKEFRDAVGADGVVIDSSIAAAWCFGDEATPQTPKPCFAHSKMYADSFQRFGISN